MDEVIEITEGPRRRRRGAAVAAGGLVLVVALLVVWLVARDDPAGVRATDGVTEADVYRVPADVDVVDIHIDAPGVIECDCEIERVGTFPLVDADVARD